MSAVNNSLVIPQLWGKDLLQPQKLRDILEKICNIAIRNYIQTVEIFDIFPKYNFCVPLILKTNKIWNNDQEVSIIFMYRLCPN